MALLISQIYTRGCERCGSIEHKGERVQEFYCYAGEEQLLEIDPETGKQWADTFEERGGHAVEAPYFLATMSELGWGKRGGRLPICPAHRCPEDVDWPG